MTDLSLKIGQLIREKRVEKKLTQEKLSLQCGIDRSYMGRIERGEVNITVEKLYEIAMELEVEVQVLLP
ncbi:helix-turn-helix domain-containing protein [Acinetobacter sp. 1125_18A]|uniref:helix-turn-helix domain-containing protein n=1 Tax=Acinetobacter sp. 1125_18A TaxID=2605959 RepID=UPI004058F056